MPRNPADRPTTEPRTEAGRRAWFEFDDLGEYGDYKRLRQYILAIEAEAAQGAAPRAEGPPRRFDNPSRCGWCGSKGEHLSDCDNPSLAAPRGNAERAEGLDKQRLALAIQTIRDYDDDYDAIEEADEIAAEYARLFRPSDELNDSAMSRVAPPDLTGGHP